MTAGAVEHTAGFSAWIKLLRPRQWVKNFFVLTPLLFSGQVSNPNSVVHALTGFLVFCLIASSVYAGNDVVDRVADQAHPIKRLRPVAAGLITPAAALLVGAGCAITALVLAWAVHPPLALIAMIYLSLNVLYTFRLKRVVILDVFSIATFFVLRLLAGTSAIDVQPSIWLLLCGGLLALYLGFAKRRHERVLLGESSSEHRSVLTEYSTVFLDQISAVLLSVTVVSYIMYTLSEQKLQEVGSYALTYSSVFVLYGVFRYLYLVHERSGGSPTETLLTDRALMLDVLLWVGYCALVIYRPF